MILRKPYAFLIKHFRVIHLAITLLLIVGAYKLSGVVNFFNDYVQNGYRTSVVTGLSSLYTPLSLYLIIFLILALMTSMLILMVHKKKPYKLYMFSVIYYLIIFFGLFFISSVLGSFEQTLLGATTARSIRDILIIVYIPQIIFIAVTLIRAIGFDIKKFNFTSDLKELDIKGSDAEEFEVNINFEGYKAKRKVHRFSRELKYYIKENKFIVIIISIILIGIVGYLIYSNTHSSFDKTYNMGTKINYERLGFTFKDAIISNLDYNGNEIDGNYYLAIKTNVTNTTGKTIIVDYNNFKLNVDNEYINPTLNYAKYFIDYAPNSINTSISHNTDKTFSLVYKIPKNDINKKMVLSIYNGNAYEKGIYIERHIFVNINPKKYDNVKIVNNYKLNDEIVFNNPFIGNTKLTLKDYQLTNKYIYDYEVCKNETCKTYNDVLNVKVTSGRSNNKLIVINSNFELDLEPIYSSGYNSLSSFAENFIDIVYKINDNIISDKSINVTPLGQNNFIAFEVPKEIDDASIIQAVITIRDQKYIVNLKA